MDPAVKDWFRRIGVSDAELKDQNTAMFIKDFVEEHGGFEAIKNLAGKKNMAKVVCSWCLVGPYLQCLTPAVSCFKYAYMPCISSCLLIQIPETMTVVNTQFQR